MVTAPSLCHGDTEGPAFRGCSRLCTIVGGRGQVSSGIVVQVHHSTASRGPGCCWVSPTHTRKEARSSPNETALGRQWIAKARQRPRKKGPFPELSLTLSSCSLPWTRRETVPSIGSAGYLSQAHITSKDNLPRAACRESATDKRPVDRVHSLPAGGWARRTFQNAFGSNPLAVALREEKLHL